MKLKYKFYIVTSILLLLSLPIFIHLGNVVSLSKSLKHNAYSFNPFTHVITFYNYKDCRSGIIKVKNVTHARATTQVEVYVECPGRIPYAYDGANYEIDHAPVPFKSTDVLDKFSLVTKVYTLSETGKKEQLKFRLY